MPISRLLALSIPLAVLALPSAALAKSSTPDVKNVGWTTGTRLPGVRPQVKDKGKITQCLQDGAGQRSVTYIFKGRLPKSAKVGVGLWVAGGGFSLGQPSVEPSNAEVMKTAFKWGKKPADEYLQSQYGITFARGPFGPQQIDGQWNAKVVVNGKLMRKSSVTIACAG